MLRRRAHRGRAGQRTGLRPPAAAHAGASLTAQLPGADGGLATLLDCLANYRITLRMTCEGHDPGQLARRSVPPSTMSLLGLVRHLAEVERARHCGHADLLRECVDGRVGQYPRRERGRPRRPPSRQRRSGRTHAHAWDTAVLPSARSASNA
ncbi:DUF664 domain-containing protein [Streptomyces globosus]|uniref:mycothiol transferase n=1 Tax=Streptomyces globosus TaxID=68209 RepID=UPI003814B010